MLTLTSTIAAVNVSLPMPHIFWDFLKALAVNQCPPEDSKTTLYVWMYIENKLFHSQLCTRQICKYKGIYEKRSSSD